MGYRYEERFRDLQPGDVQGAVVLYGPRAPTELATDVQSAQDVPARPADARPLSRALGTRALCTFSLSLNITAHGVSQWAAAWFSGWWGYLCR